MKLRVVCAAVAAMAASAATAAPTQWTVASGGNGHYYEFVGTSTNWTTARANALASSYLGNQGYLATVTSAAENQFLLGLGTFGWLGGSDAATEGDWIWVDGPEAGQLFWRGGPSGTAFGYASWNGGEPNDAGNEDYLDMQNGLWNDLPSGNTRGYFVEYSAAAAGAVPEPATWAMMIAGFGLVGGALRNANARRRKVSVAFA